MIDLLANMFEENSSSFVVVKDWMNECAEVRKRTVGRGEDAREIVEFIPKYRLLDFLRMRSDPEAYGEYFTYFLPAVGRKSFWRHLVSNAESDADLSTISNEAFGLLVLENHWDRWVDMYHKSDGVVEHLKVKRRSKDRNEKSYCVSNIAPKYTQGGVVFKGRRRGNDGGKGWSAKGIERFNELFDMVKLNRMEYPEFVREWVTKERRSWKRKKNVSGSPSDNFPVARHELGLGVEENGNDGKQAEKKRKLVEEEVTMSVAEHLLTLGDEMPSDSEEVLKV